MYILSDTDASASLRLLPLHTPLTIVGRAARLYWALECSTDRVVLLKDTWRYPLDHVQREGTIMETLSDVPNVPNVVCHGDVHWVEVATNDNGYVLDVHGEYRWLIIPARGIRPRRMSSPRARSKPSAAQRRLLSSTVASKPRPRRRPSQNSPSRAGYGPMREFT